MIGPADLSNDMGIPGQIHHPRIEEAFREVIIQCNKYGVAPGIHLGDMADVHKWVGEGMRFISYSYDSKFLKDAFKESLLNLRLIADRCNNKQANNSEITNIKREILYLKCSLVKQTCFEKFIPAGYFDYFNLPGCHGSGRHLFFQEK